MEKYRVVYCLLYHILPGTFPSFSVARVAFAREFEVAFRQMKDSKFDDYRDSYEQHVNESLSFIKKDRDFFAEIKVQHLLKICEGFLAEEPCRLRLLDVGCGVGLMSQLLQTHMEKIVGIDVSAESISKAKEMGPGIDFLHFDGKKIPYADESFDISLAVCVLHHVEPENWTSFIQEMRRVTKKGGLVAIFEHNPFNPLTQLAVSRCEFDDDAVLLSLSKTKKLLESLSLKELCSRYITFFPFRSPFLRKVENWISFIPLGAQYYVVGKK